MDKDEVRAKLKELAKKKGKKVLTLIDIKGEKKLHHYLYQHYDSVADALEDAGLEASVLAQRMRMTDEERLRILYELGKQIGKRPRNKDIRNKGWYKIFNRFGSLEEAYEKAIAKYGSPGKRIKDWREKRNISQEELAHRTGIYRTYIGHLENARYSPSAYIYTG